MLLRVAPERDPCQPSAPHLAAAARGAWRPDRRAQPAAAAEKLQAGEAVSFPAEGSCPAALFHPLG